MRSPLGEFKIYWKRAHQKKDPVADNIYLATVDAKGRPHVRTVLLKTIDENGVGFVTNRRGPKVEQMKRHSWVEGCMAWPKLCIQVRFSGKTKPMRKSVLRKLWKMRPRAAQLLYSLGIPQSSPLPSFEYLLRRVADLAIQWRHKKKIPLSPNYVGFVIEPTIIEFLQHNPSRLNLREYFQKTKRGWEKVFLAP